MVQPAPAPAPALPAVQVADGGPGMTLGRWLDMRGIQVNSYPAKFRNSVSRAKRPLDIGKGLLTAGGSVSAGSSGGPTIQLDVSQLLAGLMAGNSELTGALKSAMTGAAAPAGSTGTTAAAASAPAAAAATATAGALSGGNADAAAGGATRLNELAAAVADMLVKELPAAAAAAAGVPGLAAASSGMAAGQGVWGEEAPNTAAQSGLPPASLAPAATCMWPEAAATTGPSPNGVPLGYAIAAQVASGLPVGPGLQQLHQQHSALASALGSAVAGQGLLGMIPSTGSAINVLRLPGPGQVQGEVSGRGSMLTGSQDQLPPLHSGHSTQHSSTTAILQMLQRHQQAAGQLTAEQQRFFGAMQPAMLMGAADQPPASCAGGAAAGSSLQAGSGMQQPAGIGVRGATGAGLLGFGSADSIRDAAAAAAAVVQRRPPPPAQWDSSGALGTPHSRPPGYQPHLQQQQGPAGSPAAGWDSTSAAAAGAAAMQGAAAMPHAAITAAVNSGGSGGGGGSAAAAAGQGSVGCRTDLAVPATGGGGASLASDMAATVRGDFVTGPGYSAEQRSFRSEPHSHPGLPDPFSSGHAAHLGQGAGLPHPLGGGGAAVALGGGALGAAERLRGWVTQATGAMGVQQQQQQQQLLRHVYRRVQVTLGHRQPPRQTSLGWSAASRAGWMACLKTGGAGGSLRSSWQHRARCWLGCKLKLQRNDAGGSLLSSSWQR
ncbi:hypothetical protein COO60DRAFT_128213 [Scenedesmus sp. NREL 46B-D3]|nr:hypothetical protein COO60DRAFT_128213 [Scenedesmus sp. NREL 46B-D3]